MCRLLVAVRPCFTILMEWSSEVESLVRNEPTILTPLTSRRLNTNSEASSRLCVPVVFQLLGMSLTEYGSLCLNKQNFS